MRIIQFHLGYTDVSGVDKCATAIQLATEISKQECAAKVKLEVMLLALSDAVLGLM